MTSDPKLTEASSPARPQLPTAPGRGVTDAQLVVPATDSKGVLNPVSVPVIKTPPVAASAAASLAPVPSVVTVRDPVKSTVQKPEPVVAPTVKLATVADLIEAMPPAPKSMHQKIHEQFVVLKDLRNGPVQSFYPYEGICKKCGWHTMQHDAEQAKALVASHAQSHWRDLQ